MPFAPHRRLTFAGIFGALNAPYEAWAFRLNLLSTEAFPTDGTDVADYGPAITDAARAAYVTHVVPLIRANARLTSVKYAAIGADGKYTQNSHERVVDIVGANAFSGAMPAQVALAVTLRTQQRGPSGRGRFYLPAPVADLAVADGLMPANLAQTFSNGAGAFVGALNAIPNVGSVCISSSKGSNYVVDRVQVGRALDTIRSRRRGLPEAYVSAVAANQPAPSTD